jgi:ribonuclease HIII
MRFKVVRICNSEANTVIPLEHICLDLARTAESLNGAGFEVMDQEMMLIARKEGVEYTIYRTGKVLIHPAPLEKAKGMAEELYPNLVRKQA